MLLFGLETADVQTSNAKLDRVQLAGIAADEWAAHLVNGPASDAVELVLELERAVALSAGLDVGSIHDEADEDLELFERLARVVCAIDSQACNEDFAAGNMNVRSASESLTNEKRKKNIHHEAVAPEEGDTASR